METKKYFELPELKFGLADLAPYMSEEQLTIHYTKHHQAYINVAKIIMDKMDKAREEAADLDMKSALKDLSFQVGGAILHKMFWENLAPASRGGGGVPAGLLLEKIGGQFGNYDRFKKEFTAGAMAVEGSGWMALAHSAETDRLLLMQIEKHNANIIPMLNILLVLDMFEHAYYLDYKNDKAKYIEAFWSIVNWTAVNKRADWTLKM
jgi:superoxide dismutase, Fe-Mn family